MSGTGVERDEKQAADLYREAARKGSSRGMYLLAQCCERGTGTAKDMDGARDLYQKAADKGYKKAREALERLAAQSPARLEQAQKPVPPKKPGAPKKKRFWWPFKKK